MEPEDIRTIAGNTVRLDAHEKRFDAMAIEQNRIVEKVDEMHGGVREMTGEWKAMAKRDEDDREEAKLWQAKLWSQVNLPNFMMLTTVLLLLYAVFSGQMTAKEAIGQVADIANPIEAVAPVAPAVDPDGT